MSGGRVVVVGLGPAGADLLLPTARETLARSAHRFVRTARHPAVDELARHGLAFRSFDDVYERANRIEGVYESIVETLVDEARVHGEVCYAVPGNPSVAERTVALLREAAAKGEIELAVVPGLSFAGLAWSRLGIDPVDGARIVDGRRFAVDTAGLQGPLLVAQCDSRLVLSEVKLALLAALDPATPITVLQRLGLPDEWVAEVPLAELDRAVEPDHLTSVFVDTGSVALAPELARFVALMEQLRGPGGCPWDAEQTHHSLTRYLLEEAYEVVEAVEALAPAAPAGEPRPGAYAALADELGDLLCQVVFHVVLAGEAGAFTMADVITGIHDKLVRRHPHVFGEVDADTPDDVMRNWEQIKMGEKGTSSLIDGLTPGLPSLLYAHKLYRKAASIGLDPGNGDDALARVDGAAARLREGAGADTEAALGELLAGAVVVARSHGVDAESALRGWSARFRDRFVAMEHLATEGGLDLAALDPATVRRLWAEAGP
jgi:tetrapyrrole methylase family protein / MazG family protein